jgi:hypothetical protein
MFRKSRAESERNETNDAITKASELMAKEKRDLQGFLKDDGTVGDTKKPYSQVVKESQKQI